MNKQKKEPIILSKGIQTLEGTISAQDYLGKKVYSASNDYVGRVTNIILSQDRFVGLIVRGRKVLFIDKDYCEPETIENIILRIDPITMLQGKIVFDSEGKRLGRVTGFERKSLRNTCSFILIKKHLFAKTRRIPYEDVEIAKKNIILKKAY